MLCNTKMRNILQKLPDVEIPICNDYPVWMKLSDNKPYWGVGSFCGLDHSSASTYRNLTDLEWDGNEIYLDSTRDIIGLVQHGLSIVAGWKKQLESEFSKVLFDIFLYVDEGMEDVPPSVSLRLWAVREGYHYINFDPEDSELHNVFNPALIITVNY